MLSVPRYRMFSLHFVYVFVLVSSLFLPLSANSGITEQRQYYERAKQALEQGDIKGFQRFTKQITDYPLYPYLQYEYISLRMKQLAPDVVSQFLASNTDLPQQSRLHDKWLRHLAKTRNWQQLIADFQPQSGAELNCLFLRARIETRNTENLLEDIKQQWLHGKSLPDVCDPVFDVLYASSEFTDELIWQRIKLAMDNKKIRLARYLSKKLSTEQYKELSRVWSIVHQTPGKLSTYRFKDGGATRDILTHGLVRLAQTDLDKAILLHRKYKSLYKFSAVQDRQIRRAMASAALKQEHHKRDELLTTLLADDLDRKLVSTIVTTGLEKRNWNKLLEWLAISPPKEEAVRNPWLYWRARAMAETGDAVSARQTYMKLADSRDYYGFLAADYLQQQYGFNHQSLAMDQQLYDQLLTKPAVARTKELLALNDYLAARREWQHLLSALNTEQLAHAALLARQWKWNDRVIITLGKAKLYDDLKLRFPLGFEKSINWYSSQHQLDKSWLYALIRTESGFFETARSPAGALGLMQVMPATGRATAKKIGWKKFNPNMLMQAEKNIPIGSAYLKNMLKRFDGNLILATAAYNAGPSRVRQWLPKKGCMEADIWIEQIPFTETRSYVKRILYYSSIYDWRLNNVIVPVSKRMQDVFQQSYANKNLDCHQGLVMQQAEQHTNDKRS